MNRKKKFNNPWKVKISSLDQVRLDQMMNEKDI